MARQATKAAKWRRPLLVAVIGALIGAGFIASGGVYALWHRSVDLAQQLNLGSAHFAVGDPTEDGTLLPAPYRDTWTMPAGGLGTSSSPLAPGGTFTQVVQLDAYSDGNRGMRGSLAGVDIADADGAGYLAARLNLVAYEVSSPQDCTPEASAPSDAWYTGPLAEASTASHELAAPGAGGSPTRYLCLRLTLDPDLVTSYTNKASVTGQVAGDDGQASGPEVSADSSWHATVAPPAGAYTPQVTFTFDHETFREAS